MLIPSPWLSFVDTNHRQLVFAPLVKKAPKLTALGVFGKRRSL